MVKVQLNIRYGFNAKEDFHEFPVIGAHFKFLLAINGKSFSSSLEIGVKAQHRCGVRTVE